MPLSVEPYGVAELALHGIPDLLAHLVELYDEHAFPDLRVITNFGHQAVPTELRPTFIPCRATRFRRGMDLWAVRSLLYARSGPMNTDFEATTRMLHGHA